MEFDELCALRFSLRQYAAKAVEEEKIKTILELARLAPTAVNKQPQRILVLRGDAEMAALAECTKYAFQAPCAFVVCADENQAWTRPYDGENSGVIDASIVGTYLMLAIANMGLGACWVGHFDPARIREKFNLPAGVRPVAVFPFGYPAADAKPAERHYQRLPLDETTVYGKF